MKKLLIVASVSIIAGNIISGVGNKIGNWCEEHAQSYSKDHQPIRVWKDAEEKEIKESFCGKCSSGFKPLELEEKQKTGKWYTKEPIDSDKDKYQFMEITSNKKCLWTRLGGLCNFPTRFISGQFVATAGMFLDLGFDDFDTTHKWMQSLRQRAKKVGLWAKKNPELAASLRSLVEVLGEVQYFTTHFKNSDEMRLSSKQKTISPKHILSDPKNRNFVSVYLLMTILKATTQGYWDAGRIKSGATKNWSQRRKTAIIVFAQLARFAQRMKQSKLWNDDKNLFIHLFAEPLLSGIANALRAGKSWEQLTNTLFIISRPLIANLTSS
ncbi:hypothetical protein HOD08_01810 [bacterium]|nr:hypothetical protein [bacterium]